MLHPERDGALGVEIDLRVAGFGDLAQSFPGSFDAVTCLEALEFLPDARAALCECVRVIRPGGLLVTTNRIGWDAWLMPGKTFSRRNFRHLLAEFPLEAVRIHTWQVDYDLAWARKKSV